MLRGAWVRCGGWRGTSGPIHTRLLTAACNTVAKRREVKNSWSTHWGDEGEGLLLPVLRC